jgi:hypothetical protein
VTKVTSGERWVVRVVLTMFWIAVALCFFGPLTVAVKLCEGVVLAYRITKEVVGQIWRYEDPLQPRGRKD